MQTYTYAHTFNIDDIKKKLYRYRYPLAAAGVAAAYLAGNIAGRRLGVKLSTPKSAVIVPKPTPEMAHQIQELLEAIDKDTVLGVKIQVVKALQ